MTTKRTRAKQGIAASGEQNCAPDMAADEMTTTVVSCGGACTGRHHCFPPGLFDVASVAHGDVGCVFLRTDGSLAAWSTSRIYGWSFFHKHLETVRDVTRVKVSSIDKDDDWKRTGVYLWKTDGHCEFHSIDGAGERSGSRDHLKVKVIDLGRHVVDIVMNPDAGIEIAITTDGDARPVVVEKEPIKGPDHWMYEYIERERSLAAALCEKIRNVPGQRLVGFRGGSIHRTLNGLGASLLWLDRGGILHLVTTSPHEHCLVDTSGRITAVDERGIVLQDGRPKAVNLCSGEIEQLPDYGACRSVDEPIVQLKYMSVWESVCISERGRAFLVTTSRAIKPQYRKMYSKKNITPEKWKVIDCVHVDDTFIAVVSCPLSAKRTFLEATGENAPNHRRGK